MNGNKSVTLKQYKVSLARLGSSAYQTSITYDLGGATAIESGPHGFADPEMAEVNFQSLIKIVKQWIND